MRKKKEEPTGEESLAAAAAKKVRDGIVAAIAVLILTSLGVVFTPLGNMILDLFPDNGRVSHIDAPDEVVVGSTFRIEPFIMPIGKLNHAGLRIEPSKNIVQVPPQSVYTLGKVSEESSFTKVHGNALQFQALEVGTARIACDLLSGDRVIASSPRTIPIVRHHTYEGDWRMKMGDTPGKLHLESMPGEDTSIYGFYKLDTGITGLVSGKFDGAKFSGVFTIGNSPSRFEVLGDTADREGLITVTGQAVQSAVSGSEWRPVSGTPPFKLELRNDA